MDKVPTLEGGTNGHDKRTRASIRKMTQYAKELEELKRVAASMVQLEQEAIELIINLS